MARRVQIIEGMFLDIATKEEKRKIDELYAMGNKGSAIVYMLKRIRDEWIVMMNNKEKASYKPVTDTGEEKRTFKVNYKGMSWNQ